MTTLSRAALLPALLCAGILIVQGVQGFRTLREKAQQQDAATEAIDRWRQSYKALAGSTREWSTRYPALSGIADLYALIRTVDLQQYGLTTQTDELVLTRVEPVIHNDIPVGLVRICMASGTSAGGAALMVNADSYSTLFTALRELARRPDIYIGNIGIQGNKDTPTALLGDFCLQLRQQGSQA